MTDLITLPRKTVQQALRTLKSLGFSDGYEVVAALRTALEEKDAEPVEGKP